MCTDLTCALCSISPGACALPLDVQGIWGATGPAPLSAGEDCDTGALAPDGDCGEYTPWSRRAAPPEVSAHMVYACILAFHRANRVSTRSPWHLQHCVNTARAHLAVWGGASLAACRKWGRVNAHLQTRDADTGACGAGGDCGEASCWGPPYDPGQHPYRVALALVWARVILRDAPEDRPIILGNLRCARWFAARANLAHLRRWGKVSAPRWTSRHPHPLATV